MGREGERGREREIEGDRERQGQTDRAPKPHRVPLLPRLCWAVPLPGTPRAPPHPPGPMPLRPHRALCLGPSAAALSLPAQHPPLWLSLCPGRGRGLASVPGSLAASSPAVSTSLGRAGTAALTTPALNPPILGGRGGWPCPSSSALPAHGPCCLALRVDWAAWAPGPGDHTFWAAPAHEHSRTLSGCEALRE